MGNRKSAGLAVSVALAAVLLTACGSSTETTTTATRPALSRETADHLARLSNRVALNLEAGATCSAAVAADDLKAAVDDSDLPATLRPGVEEVATDLVNQVNCPPPPPPPEPEPEPEPKEKKPKDEHGNGDEQGKDHGHGEEKKHEPPGHGGVPPGQAKIKGEEG